MSTDAVFTGRQVTLRRWRLASAAGAASGGDVESRALDEVDLNRLSGELRDPDTLAWVDVVDPSAEDLQRLGEVLDLSSFSVEDVLAPHERPKVTRHGPQRFFFMTYAVTGRGEELARISGFVLPGVLLTFRQDDSLDLTRVTHRLDDNRDLAVGIGALVYTLLDVIVDGYFNAVEALDDEIEGLEDVLFDERPTGKDFVKQVYGLRKDLVALRRAVLPMREVVNGLLRHHRQDGSREPEELVERYDDLYDHIMRVAEWTESLRDMISTTFDSHLSLQDARLNVVMRRLAGWAAVLAVPTAISGWFGQNVPYPGFGNRFGMWSAALLTVGCTVGVYLQLRRRDWL